MKEIFFFFFHLQGMHNIFAFLLLLGASVRAKFHYKEARLKTILKEQKEINGRR